MLMMYQLIPSLLCNERSSCFISSEKGQILHSTYAISGVVYNIEKKWSELMYIWHFTWLNKRYLFYPSCSFSINKYKLYFWVQLDYYIRKQFLISIFSKLGVSFGIFKNVFGLKRLEPFIESVFKLGHSTRSASRFLLLSIRDPQFSRLSCCKFRHALHTSKM